MPEHADIDHLERLIRLPEVREISGLSRSEIYRRRDFPKRIALGPRTTVWRLSEVLAFVRARVAERDEAVRQRSGVGEQLREARLRKGRAAAAAAT